MFILVGGSSGVIPERAEVHVGVALDDAARQGVGGGSGRLAAGAGPQVNGVTIRVVLRGRGKAGLPEIHLEVVVLDLEAGEEDERDDRRHDATAARLVLHRGGAQGLH